MPADLIDGEFKVIAGPLRHGDRHPKHQRWVYVGVDINGHTLWRRPPRFNRWQVGAMMLAAVLPVRLGIYLIAEALAHH